MADANLAAGTLDKRVVVERQVVTVDSAGVQSIVWEHYADRWANVRDLSGNALMLAQQIQSEVRTRITLRYDNQIRESMRILFRGFVFDVKSVQTDPDSGLEYLTLMCARGLNAG